MCANLLAIGMAVWHTFRHVDSSKKNPHNGKQTDQADNIGQTDHMACQPVEQNLFSNLENGLFSHLPDLTLSTFNVDIFVTFS